MERAISLTVPSPPTAMIHLAPWLIAFFVTVLACPAYSVKVSSKSNPDSEQKSSISLGIFRLEPTPEMGLMIA